MAVVLNYARLVQRKNIEPFSAYQMTSLELDQRLGETFTSQPSIKRIAEFLASVERTSAPHDWPTLATTKHPKGGAPKILAGFAVPARLRGGLNPHTVLDLLR